MQTLGENLKTHFKIVTVNISTISEDYEKKFFVEFKSKKIEEIKQILDNEQWTQTHVNEYFQGLVEKINSLELFEKDLFG